MTFDETPRLYVSAEGPVRVRIRSATVEDAPVLAWLHAYSQRMTYVPLVPGLSFEHESESEARWRSDLAATDHRTLAAVRDDGEVVAFGMLRLGAVPYSSVRRLHVHPDAQGWGVGSALLQSLVDLSRARARDHLVLHVLTRNRRAREFYERLGWRRTGSPARRMLGGCDVGVVTYEYVASRFDSVVRLRPRRGEETS